MANILLITSLTGLLFLSFLYLLISGIRKRRNKLIYTSLLVLFCTLGAVAWTGYLFASKAYTRVKNVNLHLLRERSGREIYQALFGTPEHDCVIVRNKKDQVIPRLDCCIWLEFTTCPDELRRIIAQQQFNQSIISTSDTVAPLPDYNPRPEWFKPKLLGNSINILRHYNSDNPNRDQLLLFSKDSTHVFYCDMAD
jgi:hypothetical protein